MKIEDLVQLLNNRLREFKLSRDYAKMSGDLERMNVADKEVLALEDTLYKLNLLVDASKSAAAKDATLAEVITDGSVAVLSDYDITPYATDPEHEEKVMKILTKMGVMDTAEEIDKYIHDKYESSPVTGEMVMSAALAYTVDTRLMMAIMEQDSRFGTVGLAVGTLNPGNVGNDDGGNTRTYQSWQEGVTAVAEWLSRHRVSEIVLPPVDTTVPPIATTTPPIASSTPPVGDIVPPTSTSTPPIVLPPVDTIPPIATTTPPIASSTPPVGDIVPPTSTSTPPIVLPPVDTIPPIATSTSPIVDIVPPTTTSTPPIWPPISDTPIPPTITPIPPVEETMPPVEIPVEDTTKAVPVITDIMPPPVTLTTPSMETLTE